MARHFLDFESATEGTTPPAGVSHYLAGSWTLGVQANGGDKGLRFAAGGAGSDGQFAVFTDVGEVTNASAKEIVAHFKIVAGESAANFVPVAMIFQSSTDAVGYCLAWDGANTRWRIGRLNAGGTAFSSVLATLSPYTVTVDTVYRVRFRWNVGGVLRARIVAGSSDAAELAAVNALLTAASLPTVTDVADAVDTAAAWNLSTSADTTYTAGRFAVGAYAHQAEPFYGLVGMATAGETAPTTAPPAAATVTVTDAGDESFVPGEEGVVITGTGFGAAQGAGRVILSPTDNVADTGAVQQTVTSWAATSIQITVVAGSLPRSANLYLFVIENGGGSNTAGRVVQIPAAGPPTGAFVDAAHLVTVAAAPAAAGGSPAAWAGLAVGRWMQMAGNLMQDVDPANDPALNPAFPSSAPWRQVDGQKGVLNSWNGGALSPPGNVRPKGALCYFGGGHNSYAGSEVYLLDLDTGIFSRASNPYPGPFNFPYADGAYPDGSAVPPHTYHQVGYHPPTKSFCLLRGMTESSGTSSNSLDIANAHFLDITTGQWRRAPVNSLLPGQFNSGGKACYDPVNDCFWIIPAQTSSTDGQWWICKLSQLGTQNPDGTYARWDNYPIANPGQIDGGMIFIPSLQLIVICDFRATNRAMYGLPIVNGVPGTRVLLTQGGTPPASKESQNAWEWCEALDAIIYWRAGAPVYKIARPATWNTGSWDWSPLLDAGNTVVPPAPESGSTLGPYSKAKVVEYSDGKAFLATVIRRDQPPVVFRLA
jgi:hypothetical protein